MFFSHLFSTKKSLFSIFFFIFPPVNSQLFPPMPPEFMMIPISGQFLPPPYPIDIGNELEFSPITQIVSSIAHLMEMRQEAEKMSAIHSPTSQQMLGSIFRPSSGANNVDKLPSARFNLIPYSSNIVGDQQRPSHAKLTTSRIINSINSEKIPPVMYQIGDLMSNNEKLQKNSENLYDMNKIKGFPIIKSDENEEINKNNEEINRKSSSKELKIYDIARKFLGLDEIPTAREGNAIAQLINQIGKE